MAIEQVGKYFSIAELTFSDTATRKGIMNRPGPAARANLGRLCAEVLDPVRQLLGCPMHVNSGYRSPALNDAVGGKPNSAHKDGRACDFRPIGMSLRAAFDLIRNSEIPYDQIIIEYKTWIHIAIAPAGEKPRRQVLEVSE